MLAANIIKGFGTIRSHPILEDLAPYIEPGVIDDPEDDDGHVFLILPAGPEQWGGRVLPPFAIAAMYAESLRIQAEINLDGKTWTLDEVVVMGTPGESRRQRFASIFVTGSRPGWEYEEEGESGTVSSGPFEVVREETDFDNPIEFDEFDEPIAWGTKEVTYTVAARTEPEFVWEFVFGLAVQPLVYSQSPPGTRVWALLGVTIEMSATVTKVNETYDPEVAVDAGLPPYTAEQGFNPRFTVVSGGVSAVRTISYPTDEHMTVFGSPLHAYGAVLQNGYINDLFWDNNLDTPAPISTPADGEFTVAVSVEAWCS